MIRNIISVFVTNSKVCNCFIFNMYLNNTCIANSRYGVCYIDMSKLRYNKQIIVVS